MMEPQINQDQIITSIKEKLLDKKSEYGVDIDLGNTFMPTELVGNGATSLNDALDIVIREFHANVDFARQVIYKLGGFAEIAKLKPKPIPAPLDLQSLQAIEVSVGDNGPSKAKVVRPDRERLRYFAKVSAFDSTVSRPGDPSWQATTDLRPARRMASDVKLNKNNKRRINLPQVFVEWLENAIIPYATKEDLYIGPLVHTERGSGTIYHDRQVLLIPRSVLEGGEAGSTLILSSANGIDCGGRFPEFSGNYSNGKKLAGNFFQTTRAICGKYSNQTFRDWSMGKIEFVI